MLRTYKMQGGVVRTKREAFDDSGHLYELDYLFNTDGEEIVFVEDLKEIKECLEFYAVNGLAKAKGGDTIDEKLAQEFYVNGEYARKVLNQFFGDKK